MFEFRVFVEWDNCVKVVKEGKILMDSVDA